MEALTISAANLDAIERNLGAVANELSGVISNVTAVNSQVNDVQSKVDSLNDEVKNLVKEIRETTIITNARQSIMYNNSLIEKKFGYYDVVRRQTEALLEAMQHSNLNLKALESLRQNILLNNPNYWLANAMLAFISWAMDDRETTELEVNNALKKDREKTSIFFALVNLELKRTDASLHWLEKYLSYVNPLCVDSDFATVLDLIVFGEFGPQARTMIMDKIDEWFKRLNSNLEIQKKQIDFFTDYIMSQEETEITMPYLEGRTPDIVVLKNNLAITSSYSNVLNNLDTILYQDKGAKKVTDVLRDLIYEYETKEQVYMKDNLKNNLIIACNGDCEEAAKLYEKQEKVFDEKIDFLSMLSNIIVYKELYKVSNETQKLALSLMSRYIIDAYERRNKKIDLNSVHLVVQGFATRTENGEFNEQIKNELNNYLHEIYDKDDKDLIIALLIINILGIVGIFVTLNSKILSMLLIVILLAGNLLLFYKLNKRKSLRDKAIASARSLTTQELEKVFAEVVDYRNIIKEDMKQYDHLVQFLNNLKTQDYVAHTERNIEIGD